MEPPEEVRARLERAGQGHLLRFWAELDPAQRAELLAALPPGLGEHCRLAAACARPRERLERLDGRVEPLPAAVLGSVRHCGPAALQRWEDEGERAGGVSPPGATDAGLGAAAGGARRCSSARRSVVSKTAGFWRGCEAAAVAEVGRKVLSGRTREHSACTTECRK